MTEVIGRAQELFDRILVAGYAGGARHCMRIAETTGVKAALCSLPLPYTCMLLTQARLHLGNASLALSAALQHTTLLVSGCPDGCRRPWQQQPPEGSPGNIAVASVAAKVRQMLGT